MTRAQIYACIDDERTRQAELWDRKHDWGYGDCSHPDLPETVKLAVLLEETGEVARAVLDRRAWDLRTELVQVAAVAVAWLEAIDG